MVLAGQGPSLRWLLEKLCRLLNRLDQVVSLCSASAPTDQVEIPGLVEHAVSLSGSALQPWPGQALTLMWAGVRSHSL